MNSAIQDALRPYIDAFMETVSERFNISRDDLNEMWSETQKKKFRPSKRSRNRKASIPTAYILFCKDERPKITGMSFAEMAKELGARWKEASDAVRQHYKQQHDDLLRESAAARTTTTTTTTPTTTTTDDDEEDASSSTTTEVAPIAEPNVAIAIATDDEKERKTPKRRTKKTVEIPDDVTDERERELWAEFAELTISELRTQCDYNNIKKSKNRNDMIRSLIAHRIALEDGNTRIDSDNEDEE